MAQDLMKISIESFRLQIYKINSKVLVSLLKRCEEIKCDMRNRMSLPQLKDINRKQTIIQAELQRRKYLNKKNWQEMERMLQRQYFRKLK